MIYTLMNPKADPARACMHIWGGASILGGGWGQSDPHLIFLPLLRLGTSPHALHTHSYYLNASCVGRANANSMCVRHFPHLTLPYYPQASHRQAPIWRCCGVGSFSPLIYRWHPDITWKNASFRPYLCRVCRLGWYELHLSWMVLRARGERST